MSDIETMVRQHLSELVDRPAGNARELSLDDHLMFDLGLASLDVIVLMTRVCEAADVSITGFGEDDLADLTTGRDIVDLLTSKASA